MDLGVMHQDDSTASASILSPEEIAALLSPLNVDMPKGPSAIQVLLNQGAEVLAQKTDTPFEILCRTWQLYLASKNPKISALTQLSTSGVLGSHALICPFKTATQTDGFIALDWTTAYILIDGLLGGINGLSIEKKPDQFYSPIEKNVLLPLIHHLIKLLGETLGIHLMPDSLTTLLPQPTSDEKRWMFSVRTPMTIGKIMISLPIEQIPATDNPFLFEDMSDFLAKIPIETIPVLEADPMTLHTVKEWGVGTHISLNPKANLMCGKTVISTGIVHLNNSNRTFEWQEER